jgi:hypothetical protein
MQVQRAHVSIFMLQSIKLEISQIIGKKREREKESKIAFLASQLNTHKRAMREMKTLNRKANFLVFDNFFIADLSVDFFATAERVILRFHSSIKRWRRVQFTQINSSACKCQ